MGERARVTDEGRCLILRVWNMESEIWNLKKGESDVGADSIDVREGMK